MFVVSSEEAVDVHTKSTGGYDHGPWTAAGRQRVAPAKEA